MKCIPFLAGVLAGMAVTAATVSSCYPDVPRRMMRDGRRALKTGKKLFS